MRLTQIVNDEQFLPINDGGRKSKYNTDYVTSNQILEIVSAQLIPDLENTMYQRAFVILFRQVSHGCRRLQCTEQRINPQQT